MDRPSILDCLPQPERDCVPPQDRQVYRGSWIFYNRDRSVSFGTETREYFGTLPAEIARAVPESVINSIACMIFAAHRTGRREAHTYLKEFVLEKLEVPDWPPESHAEARLSAKRMVPALKSGGRFIATDYAELLSNNVVCEEREPFREIE